LANITKAKYRLKASKGEVASISKVAKMSKEKLKQINKHYYIGVAYYTAGEYESALKEFQAVVKLDPNHALALKNISKIKKRLKIIQSK